MKITENHVEEAALEWLGELGYEIAYGPDIGPEGAKPERASYGDVVLQARLTRALQRVNPSLPEHLFEDVARKVRLSETPSTLR